MKENTISAGIVDAAIAVHALVACGERQRHRADGYAFNEFHGDQSCALVAPKRYKTYLYRSQIVARMERRAAAKSAENGAFQSISG